MRGDRGVLIGPAGELDVAILSRRIEGLARWLVSLTEAIVHQFDKGELFKHQLITDLALSRRNKGAYHHGALTGSAKDCRGLLSKERGVGTMAYEAHLARGGKEGGIAEIVEDKGVRRWGAERRALSDERRETSGGRWGVERRRGRGRGERGVFEARGDSLLEEPALLRRAAYPRVGSDGTESALEGPVGRAGIAMDEEAIAVRALDEPPPRVLLDVLALDGDGLGGKRLHIIVAMHEERGATKRARVVAIAVELLAAERLAVRSR